MLVNILRIAPAKAGESLGAKRKLRGGI